jgi:hypothetical protein
VRHFLKSPWARIATAQVAVMLLLQALNLAVAVPRPSNGDPEGYYAWARSWLEDGDSDPTNQLTPSRVYPVIEINGRPTLINRYPIGWSAAVFPFMALGHEIAGTRRDDGKPRDEATPAGLAPLVVRMAWIGVYLWTLLGVLATYDSIRRLVGLRAAVLGTVAAWLGTSAFAYTWKSPAMAHPISLAAIALSFWCAVRARGSRHAWAWSLLWGLFASLTVCARVVDGIVLLPSFFLLLQSLWDSSEEAPSASLRTRGNGLCSQQEPPLSHLPAQFSIPVPRAIVTACSCALLGFLPLSLFQMSIWHQLYGEWYFNGYAATGFGFSPSLNTLANSLFNPVKGSLLWHPVILLALGGLGLAAFAAPRDRSIRLPAGLMFAVVVVTFALYGSWGAWPLGDGYGARWTADYFWIWAFGLALLFARSERIMRPVIVTVTVFSLASLGWIGGQILGLISLH